MHVATDKAKFSLGRIIFTSAARSAISEGEATKALHRHETGDWGHGDEQGHIENDEAVIRYGCGAYLISNYRTAANQEFLVFTNGRRSETVVFLVGELPANLMPEMFHLLGANRTDPHESLNSRRDAKDPAGESSTGVPYEQSNDNY